MSPYKGMEKKGLVVLGMHKGEGSDAEIAWVAASKKWPWPVFNNGNVRDFKLGANPQIFIFDDEGKALYSPGSSGDYVKALSDKIGSAPDLILGRDSFTKFAAQAKDVLARKNLGKILNEAGEKSESGDEAEKNEAVAIAGKLKKYAETLEARAARFVEDGLPSAAMEVWKTLADQFKDSDVGKEAAEELAKNKADAGFKLELEAEKAWKGVEQAYYKIHPPRASEDIEKWKTKNAAALKPVFSKLEGIRKKCGETKAFQAYAKRIAWTGFQ